MQSSKAAGAVALLWPRSQSSVGLRCGSHHPNPDIVGSAPSHAGHGKIATSAAVPGVTTTAFPIISVVAIIPSPPGVLSIEVEAMDSVN